MHDDDASLSRVCTIVVGEEEEEWTWTMRPEPERIRTRLVERRWCTLVVHRPPPDRRDGVGRVFSI